MTAHKDRSEPGFPGQALVIILLVLAVASTISLSLVARTVTDISVTTRERESARAFSAAEAGIERALISGSSSTDTLAGGEGYNVEVSVVGGTREIAGLGLSAGDTFPVWFVSHDDVGALTCSGGPCFAGADMTLCWGEEGSSGSSSTTPAIQVSIIYTSNPGDYRTSRVARGAYDPNSSRRGTNNFESPDSGTCSIGSINYAFRKTLNFVSFGIASSTPNVLQTARVRLIYNTDRAHPVGISAGSDFPTQGKRIISTGQSGESTRRVEVVQNFPDLPPIFDFGAFSPGSLTK